MSQEKNQKSNGPVLLIFLLALVAAFFGGVSWGKKQSQPTNVAGVQTNEEGAIIFATGQSKKPTLKFFVMSYCPYGNQAEFGLKPVFDLLKNNVDWQPRYIVSKATQDQIKQMCASRVYDEMTCQQYIDQGYFPDQDTCKAQFYETEEQCLEEESKECLATETGDYYCSLHGKKELNQDIREICAFNQEEDKTKWWQFVDSVNNGCTLEEIDSCWQGKAEEAGLDKDRIQECFNKNAVELLDKEIAQTEEYSVTGSPSVFINDAPYPPESAYAQQDSTMVIGENSFTQDQYRSPEALKQAICAAFKKTPKECKQELTVESSTGGSCN